LEENPLKGRFYSWSNKQENPLLERLDWIFTSAEWTSKYPDTMAIPLAKLSCDHIIPIQIKIGTKIPKARIFRFEEYWTEYEDFNNVVATNWYNQGVYKNSSQDLTAKFKTLRHG
jgi:hypothetical protein